MKSYIIDVIIPAYNEEESISKVVCDIPKEIIRNIIVSNNGSKDGTKKAAQLAGAIVVDQPLPGYGNACQKAISYIKGRPVTPDIVVFIDGDYSDYPEKMPDLVRPIIEENVDLVIGSRALGEMERGAMTPPQIFGNWLATNLIRIFFKYRFTDLGPFRAIRWDKLLTIGMTDKNFGWTVEMQVKAAKQGLICTEIPVPYRRRIGKSKVSGTVRGTILAGQKILWTIFKHL